MGVTLWIVLAFVLGVLFGRLTARGAGRSSGDPTGIGSSAGAQPDSGLQFGPAAAKPVMGNPNGAYRVTLLSAGNNKINVIKAVRTVTRMDLKDAKNLVDNAPRELVRVDTVEQAQAIVRAFQGIAAVRLDGPGAAAPSAGYGYTAAGDPPRFG